MPDWTANEERYQAEYRGESIYDAPPVDHGLDDAAIAQAIVDEAFEEASALADADEEKAVGTEDAGRPVFHLDYSVDGEAILVRRIAEALRARRAA
jgi:phosphoribosyl-ATP pyrophosphohydrolase